MKIVITESQYTGLINNLLSKNLISEQKIPKNKVLDVGREKRLGGYEYVIVGGTPKVSSDVGYTYNGVKVTTVKVSFYGMEIWAEWSKKAMIREKAGTMVFYSRCGDYSNTALRSSPNPAQLSQSGGANWAKGNFTTFQKGGLIDRTIRQYCNTIKKPSSVYSGIDLDLKGLFLKNYSYMLSSETYDEKFARQEREYRKSVVNRAYNKVVEAVEGLGTNPDEVLSALKTLENPDEFNYFLTLFKDKKTGYDNFETMVNEEYDMFNYDDVVEIIKKLALLGVLANAKFGVNGFGQDIFGGGFKIGKVMNNNELIKIKSDPSLRVGNYCSARWEKALPNAVNFWKNWLNDPITKDKIKKLWGWDRVNDLPLWNFDSFHMRWIEALNKIKLNYYDYSIPFIGNIDTKGDAFAFVNKSTNENIYINCSLKDPDPEGTLVHEIQHILYHIKPINPEYKINDVFVDKNTIKQTEKEINASINTTQDSNVANNNIVKNKEFYQNKWKSAYENTRKTTNYDYFCKETEKMSNIMSIRKTLKINPGDNITYNMIKPYIQFEKRNTDITWLLYCWVENGFPDITQMLNKINELALNYEEKNNSDNKLNNDIKSTTDA